MKIETDAEREEMRALANLLSRGLPESSSEIVADVVDVHPKGQSTFALLKNMSDILHSHEIAVPRTFPTAAKHVPPRRPRH